MVLTTSQNDAIKKQMEIFERIYPDATFDIRTRMKTLALVATYTMPNARGGRIKMRATWEIGKRGKVTLRSKAGDMA